MTSEASLAPARRQHPKALAPEASAAFAAIVQARQYQQIAVDRSFISSAVIPNSI